MTSRDRLKFVVVVGPHQTRQRISLTYDSNRYRSRSSRTVDMGRNRHRQTSPNIKACASSSVQTCPADVSVGVADGDAEGDSEAEGKPDAEGSRDVDGDEEPDGGGGEVVPSDGVADSVGRVSAQAGDVLSEPEPESGARPNVSPRSSAADPRSQPRARPRGSLATSLPGAFVPVAVRVALDGNPARLAKNGSHTDQATRAGAATGASSRQEIDGY